MGILSQKYSLSIFFMRYEKYVRWSFKRSDKPDFRPSPIYPLSESKCKYLTHHFVLWIVTDPMIVQTTKSDPHNRHTSQPTDKTENDTANKLHRRIALVTSTTIIKSSVVARRGINKDSWQKVCEGRFLPFTSDENRRYLPILLS